MGTNRLLSFSNRFRLRIKRRLRVLQKVINEKGTSINNNIEKID